MTSEEAIKRLEFLLKDECECLQCKLDKEAYRVILKKLKERTNEALVMRRQRDNYRKSYNNYVLKDKVKQVRDKLECLDWYGINDATNDLNKILGDDCND